MFFCDPCKQEKQWPESFSISRGRCEVCDKLAYCYDVPSSFLPIPMPVVATHKIYHGSHRKEDKNG